MVRLEDQEMLETWYAFHLLFRNENVFWFHCSAQFTGMIFINFLFSRALKGDEVPLATR